MLLLTKCILIFLIVFNPYPDSVLFHPMRSQPKILFRRSGKHLLLQIDDGRTEIPRIGNRRQDGVIVGGLVDLPDLCLGGGQMGKESVLGQMGLLLQLLVDAEVGEVLHVGRHFRQSLLQC